MKRSEINRALMEMEEFCTGHGVHLPPFARFSPKVWKSLGAEADEIRDCHLGWDITDYGTGDFDRTGFSLFTLRNGNRDNPRYPKPYAEKLLYLKEGQYAPRHLHRYKTEDIINRAGGVVLIQVYNSLEGGDIDCNSPVVVHTDGMERTVKAGDVIELYNGESITVTRGLYHDFRVKEGTGAVLLGEVSMVNDDFTDNYFNPPVARFPVIDEDDEPVWLLCNEYPTQKGG